ncbi:MAG TPA: sensor histidine kinase, partial [Candidatus Goldiibacteriota bacterium]|nr:sensor histidine kinase [Candidatus Goldiibacteriota bacterium]
MKLKTRLILSYFIAGFFPLLVLGIWSILSLNRINLNNMSDFYKAQLYQVNNNINTLLSSVSQDVENLSSDAPLNFGPFENFTNFLKADEKTFKYNISSRERAIIDKFHAYREAHPYVNSVYMGFVNGSFVRSEPRPRPTKYDPRERIWYTLAAAEPGKIVRTPPYLSLTYDDVNIAVAKSIYENGRLRGVMGIDLTLDRMSNFVHNIRLLKGSYIMLVDADGMILTNPDKSRLFKHISVLNGGVIMEMMSKQDGFLRIPLNNTDSYIFYFTSPELGWKICAVVPVKTAQGQGIQILLVMLAAIILLAVLCAAVSFYLADKLTNPFNRLINDMQGLSEKIKKRVYIERINAPDDEELQRLADAFNEMGRSLSDAYLELDNNLKRITELDRLKSSFVSMVSHELKTPLAIIKNSSSLLLKSPAGSDERQKELLDMIQSSANKFQAIIDDLLDISKIESGIFKVNKVFCDISAAADACVRNASGPAAGKNITIERKYADNIMWQADPYMTDRIISNLLNNAVKFSPENSGITVEIGVLAGGKAGCPEYLESIIFINDEYLKISITDRGPGITDTFKDKIFDKFFQIEDILTRSHQGAGIG